jgi:nucleoside-diphosphate-sugar epimerase
MKIAVTGATGFIGSHLVEELVCRGHQVTCLARTPDRTRGLSGLRVRFVYGSMDSPPALASLVSSQDAIVHVAGLTKAPTPEDYVRVNVGGTENLLSVIRDSGGCLRRFVYFSSAETMGPSLRGRPLTEEESVHPFSAYGKSKVMAEQRLQELGQRIPVTIVRPPGVYGPRDRDFAILFRLVSRGLLPVVSPSPAFSVVYVKNLVAGICLVIERPQETGLRSYFFTDGPALSWLEFGETVARALGRRPLKLKVPLTVVRAIAAAAGVFTALGGKSGILSREKIEEMTGSWVVSDERARRELDYQPAFSTEQGVRETATWYRAKGWL